MTALWILKVRQEPWVKGVRGLLRKLNEGNLLGHNEGTALADMVGLLNFAVHGGEVDQRAAAWALDEGRRILVGIEKRTGQKSV